jgi:hypothetical protein
MTALDEFQAMLASLYESGYSSLYAMEEIWNSRPALWRAARAEQAQTALRKGLVEKADVPLDYRVRREVRQALAQGGERQSEDVQGYVRNLENHPQGETSMSATDTLMKLARALVDRGEAATIGKALDIVGLQHTALWRQHRTEAMPPEQVPARKTVDPQQVPAYGETPSGALPPSRTKGQIAYDAIAAQVKSEHPAWNQMQVHAEVLARDEGKAAFAQHSTEMRQRTRG